jgi:peptide/nickel transport system substrate-binding protein
MLEMLANSLFMMSKKWCEAHNAVNSQDFTNKEESYTARNAMGTGPFTLVSRDPDVKTVMKKNPNWWGLKDGRFDGNVDDIVYTPVKEGNTRMSALIAGDLDFVLDPPPQDVDKLKQDKNIKVYEGRENRVIFLQMDQARDELKYSNVKGKNPFKDLRVRKAFYQAIDVDAINKTVMRGLSVPTAINLPNPEKAGIPKEMDKRIPFDPAASKKLLAEAGYPNGFEASLKLPPVGYAQRAGEVLASQLGKIGIKVAITQLQWPQWLAEVFKERNYDLTVVAHTEANDLDRYARDGYYWNYNSPEFKAKWREVVATTDFTKRDELLKDCQRIIARDAVNGFLYQLAKVGVWKKELVGMWQNDPSPSADFSGVYWKA